MSVNALIIFLRLIWSVVKLSIFIILLAVMFSFVILQMLNIYLEIRGIENTYESLAGFSTFVMLLSSILTGTVVIITLLIK